MFVLCCISDVKLRSECYKKAISHWVANFLSCSITTYY